MTAAIPVEIPVEIRRATPDDLEEMVTLDHRNFGVVATAGDVEAASGLLDLDRFLVAVDGDRLVAAGGSFAMDLTVPGGHTQPMAGVTWVSVLASHRRRGILRRLMAGFDELSVDLDEPLLGLTASEGPIYERFGYGIATRYRVIEIDRRRAAIDPRFEPEPVRLAHAGDHIEKMLAIYDRYRITQPGEVSRSEALFRDQNIKKKQPDFAALHPDGYAIWEIEPAWNNGHPAHILTVKDLIAVTPEAELALWNILFSIDLVGPIRAVRSVAVDDTLPYLLTDQRALRTVELNDGLWLKVLDAARSFGARSYRGDDELTVAVVEQPDELDRWDRSTSKPIELFTIGSGGGRVVDQPPDLVALRSALGPLLVGVSPSELAAGRRLRAEPAVLDRADSMLAVGRAAHCRTAF